MGVDMGEWMVLILPLVIAAVLGKLMAKLAAPRRQQDGTGESVRKAGSLKHAQMAGAVQWRAAKARQDDAEQVHSIKMDSCESRLESLRVLYEAGILDREEYAQRVVRVKMNHAHGTQG